MLMHTATMDVRFFIGLLGSLLLISGVVIPAQRNKNVLFAAGNVSMFAYALVGYVEGGTIFFVIQQMFIMLSTLCMLLQVPDKIDTTILTVGGIALIGWSLSLFQGYGTVIFVVGLSLLGVGLAMDTGTRKRDVTLSIGSFLIAIFSFLMRDWIFTILNALFALFSWVNVVRSSKQSGPGIV